jgi:hypothetical protein
MVIHRIKSQPQAFKAFKAFKPYIGEVQKRTDSMECTDGFNGMYGRIQWIYGLYAKSPYMLLYVIQQTV